MCRETCLLLLALLVGMAAVAPAEEPLAVICRSTTETMVIDGRLDEKSWAEAQAVPLRIPVTHQEPLTQAMGRVCWNSEFLFVSIDALDQDLQGSRTEPDTDVFRDDVLEFFFRPGGEEAPYHNIEINVLGTVFDAMTGRRASFDFANLQRAVLPRGTVNQSGDKDEGWTLEMAIPLAEVGGGGFIPAAGTRWKVHFARYDYSTYLPDGKELSSSAPLTKVNFHWVADWQPMLFR